MIIPLPFIVSLLFTITYATDFEYKIELDRCKVDMNCFVRQSCITTAITGLDDAGVEPLKQNLVPFEDEPVKLEGGKCDAVVQIKRISKTKYLFIMELTSASDEFNINEGFGISQGKIPDPDPGTGPVSEVQIECKNTDKPTGREDAWKLEYAGLNPLIRNEKKLFCSVILTLSAPINKMSAAFGTEYDETVPWLQYHRSSDADPQMINCPSDMKSDTVWSSTREKCNGDHLKSVDILDDKDYMFSRVDTLRMEIKCTTGKMNAMYDGALVDANEIICKEHQLTPTAKQYLWTLSGPSLTEPVPALKTKPLEISCKIPYCTQCTDALPSLSQEECPTCAEITPKEENGCKTLTCPEDKYTIDGKNELTSPKEITCDKKADGTSGWNLHDTADPRWVDKASCYTFKGCDPFPKLQCPEGVKCKTGPVLNKDIFNYTCPDTDAVLQQNKKPVTPICNKETHDWKDIDTNVDLYCAVEEKEEGSAKEGEGTSSASTGLYITIVLVVIGIAAAGGFLFWKFVYKKRQDAKKTTKKEEGTSKKSSKKVESKSGADGSSNEAKKEEKKSDPNKESEKPAAEAAKDAPKDGKETPAEPPKETPKDAAATPAAAAATPGAPPSPGAAAPPTPAAGANNKQEPPTPISNITSGPDSAPAPADATPV